MNLINYNNKLIQRTVVIFIHPKRKFHPFKLKLLAITVKSVFCSGKQEQWAHGEIKNEKKPKQNRKGVSASCGLSHTEAETQVICSLGFEERLTFCVSSLELLLETNNLKTALKSPIWGLKSWITKENCHRRELWRLICPLWVMNGTDLICPALLQTLPISLFIGLLLAPGGIHCSLKNSPFCTYSLVVRWV